MRPLLTRLEWGQRVPPARWPLIGTPAGYVLGICSCPSCLREGRHDDECSVHLADNEALDEPPCDCGARSGVPTPPENAIASSGESRTPDLAAANTRRRTRGSGS